METKRYNLVIDANQRENGKYHSVFLLEYNIIFKKSLSHIDLITGSWRTYYNTMGFMYSIVGTYLRIFFYIFMMKNKKDLYQLHAKENIKKILILLLPINFYYGLFTFVKTLLIRWKSISHRQSHRTNLFKKSVNLNKCFIWSV